MLDGVQRVTVHRVGLLAATDRAGLRGRGAEGVTIVAGHWDLLVLVAGAHWRVNAGGPFV